MKTQKNYFIVAALMLFTMVVSCKKENVEPVTPSPSEEIITQQAEVFDADTASTERNTGALLLSPVAYDKLPKVADVNSVQSLPTSYYLSCPPIKNQGSEGSCVGFGAAYAGMSIFKKYATGAAYSYNSNIFSPEYIYNQIKVNSNCTSGSYITDALNKMKTFLLFGGNGVCHYNLMPYSSTNGCSTQPSQSQRNDAANHTLNYWGTISRNVTSIKNELVQHRGVIVGGPVDTEFQNLGNNVVYTHYNSSHYVGGHCYCIIGYSDAKHAFKIMNSWGTGWGSSGFGWIDYNLVSTSFLNEAYVIVN